MRVKPYPLPRHLLPQISPLLQQCMSWKVFFLQYSFSESHFQSYWLIALIVLLLLISASGYIVMFVFIFSAPPPLGAPELNHRVFSPAASYSNYSKRAGDPREAAVQSFMVNLLLPHWGVQCQDIGLIKLNHPWLRARMIPLYRPPQNRT